uniref:Milk fat globule EGF and factor V/VIII domain containing b n=1 Tax=Oryzias sinensis TaxID=183150 RepID=A0A8C7X8D2_9TELE
EPCPSVRLLMTLYLTVASALPAGDPCEVNMCSNGGTCVPGTGTPFICICPDGFSGDTCNETETGPCIPNPCQNDGVCEATGHSRRGDVFNEYVCKCQPGYEGVHCQTSCISLLGMEGGGIAESQISASSVRYSLLGLQRWGPELARLHKKGLVNAWSAAAHDKNPWIQINMQRKMRLTGIVTQGASRMGSAEFIKAFKVASSLDGKTYTMYRTEGQRKDHVFVGNVDNDSTKTNLFDPPIIAQYIRIVPVVCRKACTLRMELVGCELNGKLTQMLLSVSSPHQKKKIKRTLLIVTFSVLNPLFIHEEFLLATTLIYCSSMNMSVLIIKLQVLLTRSALQEMPPCFNKHLCIFPGNSDNNVHKKNIFEPAFYSRYVRILPWEWHERITLRMELLGCDE